jgi:hypothetical protein
MQGHRFGGRGGLPFRSALQTVAHDVFRILLWRKKLATRPIWKRDEEAGRQQVFTSSGRAIGREEKRPPFD